MNNSETNMTKPRVRRAPAMTPESRENQLISAAVDLAEKKIKDGTASNQLIIHYLKLGSTKERLEKEKLENEVKLLKAKTEALESAANIERIYQEAINAMRSYGGQSTFDEDEVIEVEADIY